MITYFLVIKALCDIMLNLHGFIIKPMKFQSKCVNNLLGLILFLLFVLVGGKSTEGSQ